VECGEEPTFGFLDRSDAECVAEALAGRLLGEYTFRISSSPITFVTTTIQVISDEHGFGRVTDHKDLMWSSHMYGRHRLREPSYFVGCLEAVTDEELFACVTNWGAGCDPGPGECGG
jgi:hypothetical protein